MAGALPAPANEFADNSVLVTGNWYRLCVAETGIYQLDSDGLKPWA